MNERDVRELCKEERTSRQLDRSDFSDSRGDSKLFNHEDATNIQMRGEGNEWMGEGSGGRESVEKKETESSESQLEQEEGGRNESLMMMIESLLIELLQKPNEG